MESKETALDEAQSSPVKSSKKKSKKYSSYSSAPKDESASEEDSRMITVPNKNADDSHSEEAEVMPEKKVDAVEEGVQGPMMRKR